MSLEDGSDSGAKSNSMPSTNVDKVAVRLPGFWVDNPALYFAQVEANFSLAGITQESTKYITLIAALDQQTMLVIGDLITTPDVDRPYSAIKERLIKEFSFSETKRIKTLLKELRLADSKPSALLRHMRNLAGNSFSEEVLKSIWMSNMPQTVQSILSDAKENLAGLADLATNATNPFGGSGYSPHSSSSAEHSTSHLDIRT